MNSRVEVERVRGNGMNGRVEVERVRGNGIMKGFCK